MNFPCIAESTQLGIIFLFGFSTLDGKIGSYLYHFNNASWSDITDGNPCLLWMSEKYSCSELQQGDYYLIKFIHMKLKLGKIFSCV